VNALTAASKEPGIRSFVYTSSSTAAIMPQPDKVIKIYTDTWDDEVVEAAKKSPNSWNVYGTSKTEAERAIWKTAKELKVPFQVACVLPNANIGPIIKPGGEETSSTASWVLRLFNGDTSVFDQVPPQWFVDVRDTARVHVCALIDPENNGQRLFAFGEFPNRSHLMVVTQLTPSMHVGTPATWNDFLAIFRKLFPDRKFPEDKEGYGKDLSQIPIEGAVAMLKKHYGKGFTSIEDCVKENTASYR
jgi:nucleoside-diphosphate-sugar epimerase